MYYRFKQNIFKNMFFLLFCFLLVLPVSAIAKEKTREKSDYSELFLHPDDPRILRKAAQTALNKRDFTRAVIFLERLTELFPEEKRLWRNLAKVYRLLNNDRAALYAENMGKNTDKIGGFKIDTTLGAGAFYDDNMFFRSGKNRIRLGKGTLILRGNAKKLQEKESSPGGYAKADIKINKSLFNENGLSFIANANAFAKQYADKNINNLSTHIEAGLHYNISDYGITVLGAVDQFSEDLKNELIQFGPQSMFFVRFFSNFYSLTSASFFKTKYPDNSDLNADFFSAGEYLTFLTAKGNFTLGGRFLHNTAKEKMHDYNGWEVSGNIGYAVLENLKCLLNVSYQNKYYKEATFEIFDPVYKTPVFNEKRADKKITVSTKIHYFFTKTMGLEGSWSYIKNDSNTNHFDYDQNIFALGMIMHF